MITREARILFGKEWRQLVASKSAAAVAAILPIFFLGVVPYVLFQGAASVAERPREGALPPAFFGLGREVAEDPRRLPVAILPIMITLCGLITPTAIATHLLISERERRTLELLVALPVRIGDLLMAKLIVVIVGSLAITLPLLTADAIAALTTGAGTFVDVLAWPVLLVCVVAYSTSGALLIAVLSRDFRTANGLAAAYVLPSLLGTNVMTMLLPGGPTRALVIALVHAVAAVLIFRTALRSSTFERLLR